MVTKVIKVAIKSNILFAAFVYGGAPRKLLKLAEEGFLRVGIPKYCLLELESVFNDKVKEDPREKYRQLVDWAETYAELIPHPRNKVFAQYQNCTNDQYDLPIIAAVVTWSPEYFVTNDKGFKEEEVQKHVKMASISELLTIFRSDPGQAR